MKNETPRPRTHAHELFSRPFRRALALRLALACLCLLAAERSGRAQAGALDTTFDMDGRATADFNAAANAANAVALQPDGKIVVAGHTFSAASNSNDFAVVRYNADGALDTTFGAGGLATFDFAGGDDVAYAVRLQSDGLIVVAGRTRATPNSPGDFAYARFRPGGVPESGANGSATADFGGDDEARALTIQANNRILLAGFTNAGGSFDFALARYDFRAAPDTSFDTDGRLTTDFGGSGDDRAFAVRLQPDGKIIAAGQTNTADGGLDFAAARYNFDGSLDATFAPGGDDGDGRTTLSFGPTPDIARAIDLQTDGRIVLAGVTGSDAASNFALVRLERNGFADPSFGTDGYVTTDFGAGADAANGVAVQADGRIVAAGSATNSGEPESFAIARYDTGGALDAHAAVRLDDRVSAARGLVIQPNGRVVLAGVVAGVGVGDESDVAVVRLLAGETFVVNSIADTEDPGDGATTLREAIIAANSNDPMMLDTIAFGIDPLDPDPVSSDDLPCPELTVLGLPSRVCRITLSSGSGDLPRLTQPAIIDGYSQPGSRPNEHTLAGANGGGTKYARILIELSGAGGPEDGLTLTGGSVVRGLSIIGFAGHGVRLETLSQEQNDSDYPGNRVEGCYFGVRPDSSADNSTRNGGAGVLVFGTDYSIVGTNLDDSLDQTERNVISNSGAGVLFRDVNESEFGEDTNFNRVQGNLIGTEVSGVEARPNGNGVVFASRGLSSGNVVGNFYKEAANVISGNTGVGVRVAAEANDLGNFIGGPGGNEVRGNLIGAAGSAEVRELFDSGLDTNFPLAPLPNGSHGVHLFGAGGTIIGTHLGGPTSGNVILFNGGDGVRVQTVTLFPVEQGQLAGSNNSILGNRIDRNDGLGIDLGGDGVTPNDGDDPATGDVIDPDPDEGANNLQNFPVITSAVTANGATTIQGTLTSVPEQTYRVEFFSCGKCDPDAGDTPVGTHGEGPVPIGSVSVTTDEAGQASFTFSPAASVGDDRIITATASRLTFTDPDIFETSEFSACREVTLEEEENAAPVVDAGADQTATVGETVNLSATFTDADSADTHTATINWGDGSPTEAGTVTEPSGGGNPGTVTGSHVYNAPGEYTVTVTVTDSAGNSGSDTLTVTVNAACAPSNVALASAGATATASSTYPGPRDYSPAGAINGDRRGLNWEAGGGWNDATRGVWPDWLQVAFDGAQTITEVRVYTLQNNFRNPVEPDASTPASLYGLIDFDVQYWDGQAWQTVPGGEVRGNDRAMSVVAFPQLTTEMIRIHVLNSRSHFSRITEVEAFGCPADGEGARRRPGGPRPRETGR